MGAARRYEPLQAGSRPHWQTKLAALLTGDDAWAAEDAATEAEGWENEQVGSMFAALQQLTSGRGGPGRGGRGGGGGRCRGGRGAGPPPSADGRLVPGMDGRIKARIICYNCNRRGHFQDQCPAPPGNGQARQ
jgi:hypothetical protein